MLLAVRSRPAAGGSLGALFGDGDGTFGTATTYSIGSAIPGGREFINGLAVADMNGDGHLDVVTASTDLSFNGSIVMMLNNGDGALATGIHYSSGITYANGGCYRTNRRQISTRTLKNCEANDPSRRLLGCSRLRQTRQIEYLTLHHDRVGIFEAYCQPLACDASYPQ